MTRRQPQVIVIGAGIGGLAAAAALAHAGIPVTVLEAHIYPGGCAATFRYRRHWFDAGATLAAGFAPGGPMELLARAAGIRVWPARPLQLAMVVHMADGTIVPRWCTDQRWETYRRIFPESLPFWEWQERTADAIWRLALALPEPHPRTLRQLLDLARIASRWFLHERNRLELLRDAGLPLAVRLPSDVRFRRFVDAQLLIAAQTLADEVPAWYGAAALDLPNRGVVEVEQGIGGIARTLVAAIERQGGQVWFRHEVQRAERHAQGWRVVLADGRVTEGTHLIVNRSPWALRQLLTDPPGWILRRTEHPPEGWGAFTLYLSLDAAAIPPGTPSHHQILTLGPLAEGRSVFLSLSPEWDETRAPPGLRAATMSTHTAYRAWWELAQNDPPAYEARIAAYQERMLATASAALPWLSRAVRLALPGTPLAFARFTRRPFGWVGGFPQRHLLTGWPTRLSPTSWLVGDSVFPGQSIPATALAGLRVAQDLLRDCGRDLVLHSEPVTLMASTAAPLGTSRVGTID